LAASFPVPTFRAPAQIPLEQEQAVAVARNTKMSFAGFKLGKLYLATSPPRG
jgi:hypothetical protein